MTLDTLEDLDALKLRAAQGDATAQFLLGTIFDEGRGVPVDERAAAQWFRQAAAQGHAGA